MKKRVLAVFLILLLLVVPNVTGVFGAPKYADAAPELETFPSGEETVAPTEAPVITEAPGTEAPQNTEAPATGAPVTETPEESTELPTEAVIETEPVGTEPTQEPQEEAATEPSEPQGTDPTVPAVSEETEAPSPEILAFLELDAIEKARFLIGLDQQTAQQYVSYLSEEEIRQIVDLLRNHYQDYDTPLPKTVPSETVAPFLDFVRMDPKTKTGASSKSSVENEGLVTERAITQDGDSCKVRVEAYATGNTVNVVKSIPVDFVLVLDTTKSMTEQNIGSQTRMSEMKSAVNHFVDAVAEQYDEVYSDHRISVITFGDSASELIPWTRLSEANAAQVKARIDALSAADEYTNTAAGISKAYEKVLDSVENTSGRIRVVLVFTDGVPYVSPADVKSHTYGGSILGFDFSSTVENTRLNVENANRALLQANNIKSLDNTFLYTIGVFEGANVEELYGKGVYTFSVIDIIQGLFTGDYGSEPNHPCTSSDPFWGYSSWKRQSQINDFGVLDIPALNRFLNLLSSNYSSVSSLGLEYHNGDQCNSDYMLARNWHFKIVNWITKADAVHDHFYAVPEDVAGSLKDIFVSVARQIRNSDVSINSSAVLQDLVTPYFEIDPSSVSVKYADASEGGTGWNSDSAYTDGSITAVLDPSGKKITVTGFDFSGYYLSEQAKDSAPAYGRKLIVEYTVRPKTGFLGGDSVPVNSPDSCVLDAAGGNVVENLEVKTVSVSLKRPVVHAKDVNAYLFRDYELSDYRENVSVSLAGKEIADLNDPAASFEGWQKEFVNLSFVLTPPTENDYVETDGTYTAAFTVSSRNKPSNAVSASDSGKVIVYTPSFSLGDSEVRYGQTFDLKEDLAGNLTDLKWVHGDHEAGNMLGGKSAPKLSLTFSCDYVRDGRITKIGDLPVTLTHVKINGKNALDHCRIGHVTCSAHADKAVPAEVALLLHSQGGELTIRANVSGEQNPEENLNFIFHVKGRDANLYIAVPADGAVTITGLSVGTYVVEAEGGWSWRYQLDKDRESVSMTTTKESVTFTADRSNVNWLSGFSRKG